MSNLIDEISKPEFLREIGPNIKLDYSKLAIAGHSFGGITAMSLAISDSRIKICMAMDPWFFPLMDHYHSLRLEIPCLIILTSSFQKLCKES